uniref:Protein SCAR n=1 Tax=Cajanus cajan TaxID=3821 RepID=A0A151RY29_CAJCA|nr:Protein SCAR2 [Cajanus cajan]
MPLCRYHIRSAHALADPELRRAAAGDDSEAILEAVAMAGLVGFLRQLGDLAQFAAEMFHDLHEEVMATVARGHSLMSRVQQLEAEVPAIEKAFLSKPHHSSFFTNGGIEWHPNLRSEQNLVTRGDLPRFIMDSYEECRGPPRLFLLDKFDVAGAGACLKRYTDPSFFIVESASSGTATVEIQREKKIRKVKQKKGTQPTEPRNGETPEVVSSHTKLHQLLLAERIENACSDPARLVKLKKKQLNGSAVEAKTGKSYMKKILEISSPDHKMVHETSIISQPVKLVSDDASESGIKILEISSITPMKRSLGNENSCSSPNEQELELNPYSEMSSNNPKVLDKEEFVFDEQRMRECSLDSYHSDDVTSDVDDYMDALATIESELETENESRPMKNFLNIQNLTDSNGRGEPQLQAQFSDSQSFGDSLTSEETNSLLTGTSWASYDNSSFRRDRNEEHSQLQAQFSDSQSIRNFTSAIEDAPSNQLPPNFELHRTFRHKFVLHDDARVQDEVISDSRPVSSGSCLMDSKHLLLSADLGSASPASLPAGSQSDETTSGPVQLHLRIEDDEEKKCLVESIVTRPDALYAIRDDACSMVSFDNNSLNNLDACDLFVHSNALLQVSNELNLAHEGECGDHSRIEAFQNDSLNEYSSEILVSGDVGLQGEDPICPSMEVDLNPCTKLLLDGQNLKSEDDITTTQLKSEDLYPVVETTPKSSFIEELRFDLTEGNKPELAELEVRHPNQQSNFEEVPTVLSGDEISGSTSRLDLVEDDGPMKHPSFDIISPPMSNLTKLEEPLSVFADRSEKEILVNEADSSESLTELAVQNAVDQPKISSIDEQSNLKRLVPCDPSDSGMRNNIQHSSLKEKIQYGSSISDLKMVSICSELDSQRSSGQGMNPTKRLMVPLKPLIPDLLPKATKINLKEMPPMPPLPPMQWRTGKVQDASLVTQSEDMEVSLASLQPLQPNKPDDKSQFGLSTSEKETSPYQSVFLPVMAVESNMHQHYSGFSVGISEHPVAVPFQFPVMVNEANGQYNFLAPEQSQIQNPVLTLQDRPSLGYVVASEGEMILNSSPCPSTFPAECSVSGADPIFQQEKPSQVMEGTNLEVKLDRPRELHLALPAECPVSGDDPTSPKEKPTQSPIQLTEGTSLEATTLMQSSINLEREQGDPSIPLVSPPSLEIEKTDHSLLPSEGKMAFPLDTSSQISEHDTEMPTGKPKNKRLLPQEDPVIDPVAALDKSRLKKVAERVMPPRAPKGDERDSLLEMIRTKSFNLRPAVVQRPPSIQGPKTNLRVAAILEKANSIRQALAGSDEDDDADSWSDS